MALLLQLNRFSLNLQVPLNDLFLKLLNFLIFCSELVSVLADGFIFLHQTEFDFRIFFAHLFVLFESISGSFKPDIVAINLIFKKIQPLHFANIKLNLLFHLEYLLLMFLSHFQNFIFQFVDKLIIFLLGIVITVIFFLLRGLQEIAYSIV